MCIVHPPDVESPAVFACAQAGCEACVEALLKHHERLVHSVLRHQWRGDVACVDLLQEGRIGLWQAVMHYDPGRGIAFSTYAWHAIARWMWRAVQRARWPQGEANGEGPSGDAWDEVASPNPLSVAEEGLWWTAVCVTLAEMVARLPDPLQEVVVVSYGLDGGPPQTLATIGRWYGVSGEMVRVWRNEGLVQLRMPLYSARLRQLCAQDSRRAYAHAQALNRAWLGRRRRRKAQR